MATVRILRSTTAGNVPSSLVSGQIAINEGDGKLYYRNSSGVVTQLPTGGATEVLEYATTANFPATGAAATLYVDKDRGRVFRWETNVYVEMGPVGGGDTALWSYFLPPAPTGVTPTAGNAQVSMTWTAPAVLAQTPITDYVVQYSSNNGTTWTTFNDGVATATSATVTGLTNGTAYVFRVAAVNGVGIGSYSAASSSVTPAAAPGAPTGVSATGGQDSQVPLTWTAPASNGGASITDYTVQHSANGGSTWTTFSRSASTATSATVTGLTNGTAYVFRVAAVNSVGAGPYSSASSSATPASSATVPGAPTNVVADLYGVGVALNWTDPASNGGSAITGYVVQENKNGDGWVTTSLTPLSGYRGYWDITGPAKGDDYVFRVAAVNSVGTGSYSAASNQVTPG